MTMQKLKLVNETKWSTADLRHFVAAGLKTEASWEGQYTVYVRYVRRNRLGLGAIGWQRMWLYLPKPTDGQVLDADDLWQVAKTLAHEVEHNKGTKSHRLIDDSHRDLAWAEALIREGFVIHPKAEKVHGLVDHQAKRAEHAKQMLAEHEAALRREQKLVRKWRAKSKYYEKVLATRDPEHLAKKAAMIAARPRFSPRAEVERMAAERYIKATYWGESFYENHLTLTAPRGYHWADGCHEQRLQGWREGYRFLKETGLEQCDQDCEVSCPLVENVNNALDISIVQV